jgi:hypothetical protein
MLDVEKTGVKLLTELTQFGDMQVKSGARK